MIDGFSLNVAINPRWQIKYIYMRIIIIYVCTVCVQLCKYFRSPFNFACCCMLQSVRIAGAKTMDKNRFVCAAQTYDMRDKNFRTVDLTERIWNQSKWSVVALLFYSFGTEKKTFPVRCRQSIVYHRYIILCMCELPAINWSMYIDMYSFWRPVVSIHSNQNYRLLAHVLKIIKTLRWSNPVSFLPPKHLGDIWITLLLIKINRV